MSDVDGMSTPSEKYRIVAAHIDPCTKRPTYYVERRWWIFWEPMNIMSLSLEEALACVSELERNDP